MATTNGYVWKVNFFTVPAHQQWAGCAQIGPSATNCELFLVASQPADPEFVLVNKKQLLDALTVALEGRVPVQVQHDGSGITTLYLTAP